VRPRIGAGHRPGAGADRRIGPAAPGAAHRRVRRGVRPRPRRRAARRRAVRGQHVVDPARRPGRVPRPPAGRPRRGRHGRGRARRGGPRRPRASVRPAGAAPAGRAYRPGAVRQGDRPGGRRRGRTGGAGAPGRAVRPVKIDVVTIFPEYLAPLDLSLIGRARAAGLLDVHVHDLRRWTSDVHRMVDDTPYGGGPGMVMRPEPWGLALDAIGPGHLVVPTPAGSPFTQARAAQLAAEPHLIFACGRYEGIDQRVLDQAATRMPVTEVSLGDYVLFGGEVAVLVMLEAVVRLLPGVLGNADSLVEESHVDGLLEAPGYTKPATWRGLDVP